MKKVAQARPSPTAMTPETKALRRRLWLDMAGCECKVVIIVNGKAVRLTKEDLCTPEAIRCNGRLRRLHADFQKHGLAPGPVMPGESGLVEKRARARGKGA